MKTILVTGGAGYIGSVLVRQLLARDYRVRVVDRLDFGGESLMELFQEPAFEIVTADVRDTAAMQEALRGVDAVVHLAAIVGDPACARDPDMARSINLDGSLQLYDLADAAGAKRFVFASTCSNYGKMVDQDTLVDESSPLQPLSVYAETKVGVEEQLLAQPATRTCKPTCLRFSTAYGCSPRLRLDLTVNEFTKELALGRELLVFGAQFWRPYCHVRDLSRAIIAVIEADESLVAFDVFNVGDRRENYRKQMIVDCICEQIPNASIKYVHKDEDPRDYRVSSDKIKRTLGFEISKTVPDGIAEFRRIIQGGLLPDPDAAKYSNLAAIEAAAKRAA